MQANCGAVWGEVLRPPQASELPGARWDHNQAGSWSAVLDGPYSTRWRSSSRRSTERPAVATP